MSEQDEVGGTCALVAVIFIPALKLPNFAAPFVTAAVTAAVAAQPS